MRTRTLLRPRLIKYDPCGTGPCGPVPVDEVGA